MFIHNSRSQIIAFSLLMVMFLSLAVFCSAEELKVSELTLNLIDDKGRLLENAILRIEMRSKTLNTTQTFDKFVNDGTLKLRVIEGEYTLLLLAKNTDTAFYNYYSSKEINTIISTNETLTLIPVAYIRGTIVDKYNTLLPDARLRVDCSMNVLRDEYATDSFGSFSFMNVPFGNYKLYATSPSGFGSVEIVVNESKLYDVEIVLDKTTNTGRNTFLIIISIIVFILAIVLVTYYVLRRAHITSDALLLQEKKNVTKKIAPIKVVDKKTTAKKIKTTSLTQTSSSEGYDVVRIKAILDTLDDTERKVVEHLMNNNGHDGQNKIRYATGIAKTSLFRCIQKLERKNVVRTESIGKFKKVYLK